MFQQNRREFLNAARLIGTGLAAGSFLPEAVAAIKGKQQSVTIPTHEFFGDIEERIDLPASWEVNVMKMAGHDAVPLSQEEMRRRMRSPIFDGHHLVFPNLDVGIVKTRVDEPRLLSVVALQMVCALKVLSPFFGAPKLEARCPEQWWLDRSLGKSGIVSG